MNVCKISLQGYGSHIKHGPECRVLVEANKRNDVPERALRSAVKEHLIASDMLSFFEPPGDRFSIPACRKIRKSAVDNEVHRFCDKARAELEAEK